MHGKEKLKEEGNEKFQQQKIKLRTNNSNNKKQTTSKTHTKF